MKSLPWLSTSLVQRPQKNPQDLRCFETHIQKAQPAVSALTIVDMELQWHQRKEVKMRKMRPTPWDKNMSKLYLQLT